MPFDNKKPIIGKLELNRKNESKLFGENKFRPDTMPAMEKLARSQNKIQSAPPLSKIPNKDTGDIFAGRSEVSKLEIYKNLLRDPQVRQQAIQEGKKPWDLARELIKRFPEIFGGFINKGEARKEFDFTQYWDILHQEQQGDKPKNAKVVTQRKQERDLLKKKFGV